MDVDEVIAHHLAEHARQAALGFIEALERAYANIGRHPANGSSRFAHELNLPGVRFWTLTWYSCSVFYVERDDHIDVWRVLHGRRDVPVWMEDPAQRAS
ncbi:type II toxin-antitoxin system RelE/ParE family toxin [Variovorax ginsengisoli]|uniref:Type II toxin-antitoxin system RelE/ParE family toxin n=1 Tax=Variovorax ginsengisoli TaxID=363844 RepID=A0ABT8S310_9BURK|nr:type II toxin-antitoxin system RelE/ParE family toxin [Variovorax ginsengisoli]MDN8614150.1 type II toxin-antitoxin system RelE/ParE family toxin [Variovorax ginsengisoli]MDO1533320.1 type II toxin-antitoxin system RelE/ParE family toxin [Variovorax ginsengisoli]